MTFDMQPILTSDLLQLRPLRREDFAALYAVACDPLIWEQHPEPNRCELKTFEAFFNVALESKAALIAVEASSGQTIGSSRFHDYKECRSQIEIGWTFLARSHWGGRYNGDMKRSMLEHAFNFVETVIFVIGPQNRRSQLAVQKIGAHRTGSRLDSAARETYVYEITRERFAALP